EITLDAGRPKVISPIDATPAARAGLKAGDVILAVDDTPTEGLSLQDAVTRMRGSPGTTVRLSVGRAGQEPLAVTLTREIINVVAVTSHLEDGRIGYLRIRQFNEQTQTQAIA